jgi:hypothetical protein
LQEAIFEAAFDTQVWIQKIWYELHLKQVGTFKDSPPTAIWRKAGVNLVFLSPEERKEWMDYMSWERNKDKLEPLAQKFGKKQLEMVKSVAYSNATTEPKRWWK